MSIPNIDFLDKLLTFLGLAIIVIAGLHLYDSYKDLKARRLEVEKTFGKYIAESKRQTIEEEFYLSTIRHYNAEAKLLVERVRSSPKDSYYSIKHKFDVLTSALDDSVKYFNSNRLASKRAIDSLRLIKDEEYEALKTYQENYDSESGTVGKLIIIGFLFFFFGFVAWGQKERFEKELIIRQNLDKPTYSTYCQSCGKEFNAVVVHANETNGNKNFHFCINCYKDGAFIEPDLSIEDLKSRTRVELSKFSLSTRKINKILKTLHGLDRWQQSRYF